MPAITQAEAQEVINGFDHQFGRIISPGKFNGESSWVPVAYEDSLNGFWDRLAVDGHEYMVIGDDLEELGFWTALGVDPSTYALILEENSDGFVFGHEYTEDSYKSMIAEDEALAEMLHAPNDDDGPDGSTLCSRIRRPEVFDGSESIEGDLDEVTCEHCLYILRVRGEVDDDAAQQ